MADYRSLLKQKFAAVRKQRVQFLECGKAEGPSATPFANPSPGHARQLVAILVEQATRSLDILSKHLGSRTHSASLLRAQVSRYPELQVRILVEADEAVPIYRNGEIDWCNLNDTALVDLFAKPGASDDGTSRITLRVLPVQSQVHFVVSDGLAYRLELDHETAEGTGNAFNPELASAIVAKFNVLWGLSAPARFFMSLRAAA
jgi:hypothetical protein